MGRVVGAIPTTDSREILYLFHNIGEQKLDGYKRKEKRKYANRRY